MSSAGITGLVGKALKNTGHLWNLSFQLSFTFQIVHSSSCAIRMIEDSTITCPKCGYQTTERMPPNACRFFYVCKGCGVTLKPLAGDCCVFRSYGSEGRQLFAPLSVEDNLKLGAWTRRTVWSKN